MSSRRPTETLRLVGGALCLDFANTVDPRHGPEAEEYLDGYDALAAWGVHAGAITAGDGRRLSGRARRRPAQAERVLARALSLRGALYALFSPHSPAEALDDAAGVLDDELRRAWAHTRLSRREDGFRLESCDDDELDRPLWAVARAAADLLLSPDRRRVGECASDTCGWLFLDTSRAGRRRWCSMEVCGNRAKARRHRALVNP